MSNGTINQSYEKDFYSDIPTVDYSCPKCNKEIHSVMELNHHLAAGCSQNRYHEVIVKNEFNKILFRCSECDYTSTSTRGLKAHIRNRHKQKSEDDGPPYECQTCGKMYRHKKSLIQHMRFECGVEPQFECYICNCRYRQKHDLKRHIKQRHFK